jgi:hypothetical protein
MSTPNKLWPSCSLPPIAPSLIRKKRRADPGEHVSPSDDYLRTAPFCETSPPKYTWLNDVARRKRLVAPWVIVANRNLRSRCPKSED